MSCIEMCDKHLMPNEWHGDMIFDTGRTLCSRLIWSTGPICRRTNHMWIWILLWARRVCIVSCQWLILSDSCSGLEKTEQCWPPGWQGPWSRTIYGEAERSWVMGPGRGDRHFITNNIILNARYTHMMWCVMQPCSLDSIQLKCTCESLLI